ncbi:hypothetical protein CDAR_537141 [Caerostris darwini]|uniref:Uncharacterized protein n=1 Tax=Caerostris darwini TaxID=1538125 RepID=A0AAV4TW82_9ARAC|nr:hypothetical protein CDAR_537141 [Caerostris darwini]
MDIHHQLTLDDLSKKDDNEAILLHSRKWTKIPGSSTDKNTLLMGPKQTKRALIKHCISKSRLEVQVMLPEESDCKYVIQM